MFARHWAPRGLAAIPDAELDRLAELRFDYLWLMGVWTTGELGRDIARQLFTSHSPSEIESSPYAIARYEVDPRYGGNDALAELRRRLAKRNIGLIVDFVPNHTARDHDWITSNPDIYIRERGARRDQVGEIAYGRDPYFPPWTDTAQLDHRCVATRRVLIETLQQIATQADGVRCDMAMLVLSDVFAKTWSHHQIMGADPILYGDDNVAPAPGVLARGEFWAEAIDAVRHDFIWIAEAYWGLEGRLQKLGFDYTYDKALYDHLLHGRPAQIHAELATPIEYQRRCVRFLENHDEPRLAASLPPERAAAALAIATTAPGMRFVHDGQIEGRRERATIQLARRPDEATRPEQRAGQTPFIEFTDQVSRGIEAMNESSFIQSVHERLLALPRAGDFALLPATDERLVAYRWDDRNTPLVVVVNYSPDLVEANVTLEMHGLAGRRIELRDVLDGATYEREGSAALHVVLQPWQAHVFTVTTKGLWNG
ncbi:MAG TPA: alpha-amylase family glycosyl hydrolase [Kofleriaceae bacterium]|nr:alpha-amylase family glycosyl hydrolase [Kofleriaceae bacterium]